MSGELVVSLVLKMNDKGSGPAARALGAVEKAMKGITASAKTAQSAGTAALSAMQKLATARGILGIRSEKEIQNEIRRTEAAYQRLAQSGTASAREQARAYDAMRRKVSDLRGEMGRTSVTAGGVMRGVMQGAAAIQAAKYAIADPIRQTMDYDRALGNTSNTVYAGQSLEARRAGMGTIHAAVKSAVNQYGGTANAALSAYQKLAGSNEYTPPEIPAVLSNSARSATANGGSVEEFVDIGLAAKRNLGLTDSRRVFNMATTAGQLGGFEIKDMRKGLPDQLAAAKNAGMIGYEGYASVLALNQATMATAGSTDSAANNVVNILSKLTSPDTAADFKKQGIDLNARMLEARAKGINPLEAFGQAMDDIVAGDGRYAELKKRAEAATGDKQKEMYAAMAQIVEGAGIGKGLQDRQAMMGFLAYRTQKAKYDQNKQAILNAKDVDGDNFALISKTPSFQTEQLANDKAFAMQDAMNKVNPLLGEMAEGISYLIRKFPIFSSAVTAASTALQMLALAAIAGGATGMVLGGGSKSASVAAALKNGGSMAASRFGTSFLGIGAMGALFEGLGGIDALPLTSSAPGLWAPKLASSVMNSGIKLGSGMLSEVPVEHGQTLSELFREFLNRQKEPIKIAPIKVDLEVHNGNIAAAVNDKNSREAKRH